ncbi:hypothetical protein EI94DRAFT_1743327, partial [Lactarius quietus]
MPAPTYCSFIVVLCTLGCPSVDVLYVPFQNGVQRAHFPFYIVTFEYPANGKARISNYMRKDEAREALDGSNEVLIRGATKYCSRQRDHLEVLVIQNCERGFCG